MEALIDNYMTSLTYFLVGRQLSSIHTDLENDVNIDLQQHGYLPLAISEMTGSTGTDEVTRILQSWKILVPIRRNLQMLF